MRFSENWWALGLGKGITDYPGDLYLWDVYLDSYTAGSGEGGPGPSLVETSRYKTYRVKNLFVDIVVVVTGITMTVIALEDSPTAQRWGTELSDWVYYTGLLPGIIQMNDVKTLSLPPPTLEPPPAPDEPLEDLPPIDGGGDDAPTLACNAGDDGC